MIISLSIILILVLIDRFLKSFMTVYLVDIMEKEFIPGFMRFSFTKNSGASFGILKDHTLFLTIVTSVVVLYLLYVIVSRKSKSKVINIAIILITAGGIGNLYDRIVYGYVVDYLEFTFINYAIFNFADALINIGAVIFFVYVIFFDRSFFSSDKKKETVSFEEFHNDETDNDG